MSLFSRVGLFLVVFFIHAIILRSFCIPVFTEAAKTYFTSMSGTQCLKGSGKYDCSAEAQKLDHSGEGDCNCLVAST